MARDGQQRPDNATGSSPRPTGRGDSRIAPITHGPWLNQISVGAIHELPLPGVLTFFRVPVPRSAATVGKLQAVLLLIFRAQETRISVKARPDRKSSQENVKHLW